VPKIHINAYVISGSDIPGKHNSVPMTILKRKHTCAFLYNKTN